MKKYITIIVITGLSLLAIFILTFISKIHSSNGFSRKIILPKIQVTHVFKLPDPSFILAGKPVDEIILNSYRHPLDIFKIDYSLKELKQLPISPPIGFNINSNYIKFNINSPFIYLSNSEGDISLLHNNVGTLFKMPMVESDQSLFLSPSTVIARSLEKKGQQRSISLVKVILSKNTFIKSKYDLPIHADGFFGNDGKLKYDSKHSRILYLYSYLGEFLSLDTNLNLIYKAKTIDTVTIANIKVGSFKIKLKDGTTADKLTTTTPPSFINRGFSIDNDLLYIMSGLKADNETSSFFDRNQPIDVYSIIDGKYLHTFYIPKYKSYKLQEFEIKGNTIIAIFDTYLITYNLNE